MAPSRLAVAFAHVDRCAAQQYATDAEHLYEVESVGPVHELDMLWVTWVRESLERQDIARAERQATLYWQGRPTDDGLRVRREVPLVEGGDAR